MRILVVTPYPPARDGIAAYAIQQVRALRRSGHDVEVLSPGPSAAHHHLDLVGPRGGAALARRVRGYDKVIVQFHPDFFYPVPNSTAQRAATAAAYATAFSAARRVEVYVHEIDYRFGTGSGPDAFAARRMWRAVDRIFVHTETERMKFIAAFRVPPARVALAVHGVDFTRRTVHTRESARRTLGIGPDEFCFLSIGFIQPHKGFDRGIRAYAGIRAPHTRYDVVGSVRVEDPAYQAHLDELRTLAEGSSSVSLHTGYVSDEMFDRWLVACDVVVLPYRTIWSSGVLERAALYDRPVIATDVGGLAEQAGSRHGVTLVADDADLAAAMHAAVGGPAAAAVARDPWPRPEESEVAALRARVQDEVRTRAASHRGLRPAGASPGRAGAAELALLSAPLRRVAPLQLPATSGRSATSLVKRVVRRLTAWQLEPMVGQVNALRAATVESIERLGAERVGTGTDEADPALRPSDPRPID